MQRAHSSAWIEWLPAEQLVEGSSPSGPVTILVLFNGFHQEVIQNIGKVRHGIGSVGTVHLCHEGASYQGQIYSQVCKIFRLY
jgi:hypothetical protein